MKLSELIFINCTQLINFAIKEIAKQIAKNKGSIKTNDFVFSISIQNKIHVNGKEIEEYDWKEIIKFLNEIERFEDLSVG